MEYKYYTTDIFTDKPFHGAQVPVFPQAEGLSDEQMQNIANELNTANTVFVSRHRDDSTKYQLRSFTPVKEASPATHTCFAAAHVMVSSGACVLPDRYLALGFNDDIEIYVSNENGQPGVMQQSIKTHAAVDRFTPPIEELAGILGLTPADIGFDHFEPLILSCGSPYLVVPIKSFRAIQAARFDFQAWSRSSAPSSLAQEVLLFSNNTDPTVADFHIRLFGPDIASHEDPPVGATIPAFANYLCTHKSIQMGTHIFSVERGHMGSRQSILNVEMDNKRSKDLTVRVGGRAVLVSESVMQLA